MSDDLDDSPGSNSFHETADRIIRGILENTRSPNDISPSGELLRAIERYHRARGIENTPASHRPSMSSEPHPDRRRRIHREAAEGSPLFVLPPPPQGEQAPLDRPRLYASSARRGRPRMAPSDRYLERHRALAEGGNGLADLQNAGRQLEQASSSVRALLDEPIPQLSSPALLDMDYSGEAEHRQSKRRRLDTDTTDSEFKGFSYGKYGQVEPGRLKMEIVSCDGGILDYQGGDYGAENVLRNDATVYCTKNNRCNLVLRHQGATVFSLKELIIKAPQAGYSAPVQEGMIFISMTSDELLTRTAQYQIQYSPPRERRPSSPRLSELPPVPIVSIRHDTGPSMTVAQARARRLYDIGLQDEECDHRTALIPSEFTANPPPFDVTVECSDSEEEDGENSSREARRRSLFHLMGVPADEESDSSDEEGAAAATAWREAYLRGTGRLRRRETTSNITLAEAEEASQIATQEAVRAVGGELMAPHAKFHIERGRSKCTVRFEPPVSGRFILLKMWSPRPTVGGNIDIQSVVARGFAGPRFCPAVAMR